MHLFYSPLPPQERGTSIEDFDSYFFLIYNQFDIGIFNSKAYKLISTKFIYNFPFPFREGWDGDPI
jgi:hypothetical protein